MKVIVIGAGRTGFLIAKWLSMNHEVTVVDRNPDILNQISYTLDVLTIPGDATLPETLREAGAGEADYLVATTDNDQTNIIVGALSKTMGDPFTIARVKRMEYLNVWGHGREILGVDRMVCAVPLVAEGIVGVIDFPELTFFRRLYGDVYVATSHIKPENLWSSEIGGKNIIIATKKMVETSFKRRDTGRILVLGGSEIGRLVARMLSARGRDVKLVEGDERRAEKTADELDGVTVIRGDAFSDFLWFEENLNEADVAVVAFDRDYECFFGSALAGENGIERVFSVVHRSSHMELFEKLGAIPVSPELETAGSITAMIREKKILGVVTRPEFQVYALSGDDMEGALLKDIAGIPGPLFREGKLLFPDLDLQINRGDIVTVITKGGGMIL